MFLLLLALTTAEPSAALPPGAALPPAEDCGLYDLIHREQFGMAAEADPGIQLRVRSGPGVVGQLVCPGWRITGPAPSQAIMFEPPAYSRRLASASVEFSVLYFGHHRDPWVVTGQSMHRCELRRKGKAWRFEGCRLIAQTR